MASDRNEPERRPGGAAGASETKRTKLRSTSTTSNSSGAATNGARHVKRDAVSIRSAQPEAKGSAQRTNRANESATKNKRTAMQRVRIVAGTLCSLLLLLMATGIGYLNWRFGQIERLDLELPAAMAGSPQNYLIVGSDTRAGISANDPGSDAYLASEQYQEDADGGGQRSDSIMILRIDPRDASARLLSLPRDLYVPIAGTTHSDRINSAFGDGPKVLIQTIQDNFGIAINHYVEVDFVGFQALINAIGGVPIYFDTPVWDGHTGLDIPRAGCATLNGQQALAFARSRYLWFYTGDREVVDTSDLKYLTESEMQANGWTYDGTADLGRISRQQMLIRTVIPIAKSKAFRNPATLNAIVGSLVENVSFDKGLSASTIVSLARRFESFDAEHLKTYSYPSTRKFVGGADVQIPDTDAAAEILALFKDNPGPPESLVKVEVLNASGIDAQAANVAGALHRIGFKVAPTANASTIGIEHLDQTQVRYAPGDEADAKLVAAHLTFDVELAPIAGMDSGTIVLVTGTDFAKVSSQLREIPAATTTTATSSPESTAPPSSSTTVVGHVPAEDKSC